MSAREFIGLLTPATYFGLLALEALRPARAFPKIRAWRLVGLGFVGVAATLGAVVPFLLPTAWLAAHRLLDGGVYGDSYASAMVGPPADLPRDEHRA